MNLLEQIESENQNLINKMIELARVEDSRATVSSAVFVRSNDELRLKNMKEVREDIKFGAKNFGLAPEKYTAREQSIVNSYIEPINRFMKTYNEEYMNIKNKIQLAEENQKVLMFKCQKISNNKKLLIMANKADNQVITEYDNKINEYKSKIKLYEDIINICDEEMKACKNRREEDFKTLFGDEKSIEISDNKNVFKRFIFKISNKFKGYNGFSKYVLQKHATKINDLKTKKLEENINKIKQNMVNFSYKIDKMLEEN